MHVEPPGPLPYLCLLGRQVLRVGQLDRHFVMLLLQVQHFLQFAIRLFVDGLHTHRLQQDLRRG